jgi:hypothetical protein
VSGKIDNSLTAVRARLKTWIKDDERSCYEELGTELLVADLDAVMDAAERWDTKGSKPFPWGCTCGKERVMPDGPVLTCRNCNTQWSNPWFEE